MVEMGPISQRNGFGKNQLSVLTPPPKIKSGEIVCRGIFRAGNTFLAVRHRSFRLFINIRPMEHCNSIFVIAGKNAAGIVIIVHFNKIVFIASSALLRCSFTNTFGSPTRSVCKRQAPGQFRCLSISDTLS